jgi:hypothetical protein
MLIIASLTELIALTPSCGDSYVSYLKFVDVMQDPDADHG